MRGRLKYDLTPEAKNYFANDGVSIVLYFAFVIQPKSYVKINVRVDVP